MNVREDVLRERIDPALTPQTLSRIVGAALGAPVTVTSWRPLAGGCWNRVISPLGDPRAEQVVLKIGPAPADTALEREHAVLRWFAEHTRLTVPEPLLLDSSGSVIPGTFFVMRRLPGRPLHSAMSFLGQEDLRRIIVRIAEEVAELHATTAEGFGGVELSAEDRVPWAEFWLPRFDAVVRDAGRSGLFPQAFLERIGAVRPGLPPLLDIGRTSTLTHYDIWAGNVMVEGAQGGVKVSGYIDVPGFWADPVRELSFAQMFGIADRLFYQVYTASHRLSDGWEVRRDLYNLKMHLKHVMMYPGERFYREGASRCLSTVEAALTS